MVYRTTLWNTCGGKKQPISGFWEFSLYSFSEISAVRTTDYLNSSKAFSKRVSPYKLISHNLTMQSFARNGVHTTALLSPEDKDANVNTLPGLIASSGADFRTSMPRGTCVLGILAQRCAVKELHEKDLVRLLRRHVVPL